MQSNNVLNLLKCTRQTLTKYVNEKKIKVKKMKNGRYEYDDEDAYKILSNNIRIIASVGIESDYYYPNIESIVNDILQYKIKKVIIKSNLIDNTFIILCNKIGTEIMECD